MPGRAATRPGPRETTPNPARKALTCVSPGYLRKTHHAICPCNGLGHGCRVGRVPYGGASAPSPAVARGSLHLVGARAGAAPSAGDANGAVACPGAIDA